jgi:hypothetical protein
MGTSILSRATSPSIGPPRSGFVYGDLDYTC